MTRESLARLISSALDPILCAASFGRGDGMPATGDALDPAPSPWPEPDEAVQVLWCAPFAQVRQELPGLWHQVRQHAPDDDLGCVDVTVDVDVLGRLVAADIESEPLADLLRGVGDVEAAAAAAELPGLPAEVAVPALADLFERLLAAARAG